MSRLTLRTWRFVRVLAVGTVGAALLAGCTSASVPHVVGVPSIGISVPLHINACTTSGSCIALGTTGATSAPTSVGEYRETNGTWSPLVVPNAPSSTITSASCSSTQCLIGGVGPSGNLMWRYDATSQSIATAAAPKGGVGIRTLDCFTASSCVAIVTSATGSTSLVSFTTNFGASWTKESPIAWTSGDNSDDIVCTNAVDCIVSATSSSNKLEVEISRDAMTSWTVRKVPRSWVAMNSLSCQGVRCVALVTSKTSTWVVRTNNFGRSWQSTAIGAEVSSLACINPNECIAVGASRGNEPWFALLRGSSLSIANLQYVPTALVDAACAKNFCTAIGVSTVLTYRP